MTIWHTGLWNIKLSVDLYCNTWTLRIFYKNRFKCYALNTFLSFLIKSWHTLHRLDSDFPIMEVWLLSPGHEWSACFCIHEKCVSSFAVSIYPLFSTYLLLFDPVSNLILYEILKKKSPTFTSLFPFWCKYSFPLWRTALQLECQRKYAIENRLIK